MYHDCSLSTKLGGLGVAAALRLLMGTLEYKITHYDIRTDPARPEFQGRYIYLFWHEYITFPVSIWGGYDVTALVSLHRDGEWITRAANHLGFEIVRGSTSRGGAKAMRELRRHSQRANLTIMPDGPKGPRRQMALGPLFLSSRLGIPIVPVGFGFDRPIRMPTWDRFAVPRPDSRARSIFGPVMNIPPKADRDELEACRQRIESILNRLSDDAERWAESGKRMQGEVPIRRLRRRLRGSNAPTTPTIPYEAYSTPAPALERRRAS